MLPGQGGGQAKLIRLGKIVRVFAPDGQKRMTNN
jgi:hypothetical protein